MRLIIGFVLIIAAGGDGLVQDGPHADIYAAMDSDKEKVRARAALMLGTVAGGESLALLEEGARKDPSVLVRLACVEGILSRGSVRALPGLFAVGALDSSKKVRALVTERIAAMVDEKSLPFVRRALEETDPRVRVLVMRTLPVPMPASFYSMIGRGLADYPEVRSAAFERAMLLSDSVRWRLFEQLSTLEDLKVVMGLADELGRVDDHRVMGLLLSIFDRGDSSPELRPVARRALMAAKRHLPVRELLQQAREHRESHTRMRAIRLLELAGGEEVIRTADALLGDPDLPVRATAAMVLARLGYEPSLAKLETMVKDPLNQRIVGHLERALTLLRSGETEPEERR